MLIMAKPLHKNQYLFVRFVHPFPYLPHSDCSLCGVSPPLTIRKARTARKVLRLFLPTIMSNLRFSSGD